MVVHSLILTSDPLMASRAERLKKDFYPKGIQFCFKCPDQTVFVSDL